MFEAYPDILTAEQLQEILHVGKSTTYRLLRTGEIRSFKVGRQFRVPKEYLLDYLSTMCYDSTV